MGFVDLGSCGAAEVFDPFGVEYALDVYYSVTFEGLYLFFGDGVFFRGGDAVDDVVGEA
jgi:hypothetical protein